MKASTMSTLRLAAGTALIGACALQSAAAANVVVAVNAPIAYGRVAVAEPVPQAAWVNTQPVIVTRTPVAVQRQPIYLYVPPAHSANWGRYCGRYNACAQPVVFVQDRWVRDHHRPVRYGPGPRGDFDRDGVSNRRDHDRDGDGVRNSRDRAPNNPTRY